MENILAAYKAATAEQRERGIKWYSTARDWATWAGDEYNISPVIIAAMIAALSPRNRWEWSLQDTIRILNAIRAGSDPAAVKSHTFKTNKLKAIAIARGNPGLLSGQKVTAFCDNIVNPGSTRVTVDIWAYRVFLGDYKINPPPPRGKVYNYIENKYIAAAAVVGLRPYEIQAVTWGVARDTGARFNETVPVHTNF